MPGIRVTLGVLAVLAPLTSGCAINAIRLDRAETMVGAGRLAETATSELMQQTRAANREVLIDVVAADPNCMLPRPLIMSGSPPRGTRYCRPPGATRLADDWEMQRITSRDINATLATIRGLSGYLDLVDSVIKREPIDIAADFGDALADLEAISGAAGALAGADTGLPALSADQKTAIGGALGLLSIILDEKYKVDDLLRIETAENKLLFTDSVTALRTANTTWLTFHKKQLSQRRTLLQNRLDRTQGEVARRPLAEALLATIEAQENHAKLAAALADVVDKLEASHTAYLALLFNKNAELSSKERKKLAQLNHDRVMGALRSLTAIIKAF
jgi:hypothetical protein